MKATTEQILLTALRLFAAEGFEAVSTARIAGELGMTKGALYKHFESKQAIFEAILRRMEAGDAEKAAENDVPKDKMEDAPEEYENLSPEHVRGFCGEMFRYWTEDPFAADFRRLLTLEQYHDRRIADLLNQYLADGPAAYTADLLQSMYGMEKEPAEAEAAELYGSMFLLYTVYDHAEDKPAVTARALAAIDAFFDRFPA